MSTEWVVDDSGVGMRLKVTSRGRYTGNSFKTEALENMSKFPLRPDDVLICSYSKCGIHWLWENVRMLLSGEVKIDVVSKECSMMELFLPGADVPSPRILNNHGFFDDQPTDLVHGKTKMILLYRNPKDVAVSFYYHHLKFPKLEYNGTFDNFLRRFAQGKIVNDSYFEYLLSFEEGIKQLLNTAAVTNTTNAPTATTATTITTSNDNNNNNVHSNGISFLLVRYEDLHLNPISERRRIASFLGRDDYDDDFLRSVRDATTIDAMRDHKSATSLKDSDGNAVMYRKGKIGDWKNHFTVGQSEWFDGVIDRVMGRSQMFKFVYDHPTQKDADDGASGEAGRKE